MKYDPMNPPAEGVEADPLPPEKVEGDSSETDRWDDNDTPAESFVSVPFIDPDGNVTGVSA